MYYYKQIDENGETMSVLSCDQRLRESETQVEITEEEYNEYIANLPEPEVPAPTGYVITQAEIEAAYQEGVQEA